MGLFTKSVEEKPLLHVFMFRKEQENHCKQKEFNLLPATLQYKVMQPMSMTENATNFDVK
jgi:hypothetical protein